MREIKFRAWDKPGKHMYFSFPIVSHGEWNIFYLSDLVDKFESGNYILMQYTGLRDRHGKEIYEGDIVRSSAEIVLVEWRGEMWTEEGFITGFSELFEGANCYEIIGNVYENPELLKE